jgi:hypothetical protein
VIGRDGVSVELSVPGNGFLVSDAGLVIGILAADTPRLPRMIVVVDLRGRTLVERAVPGATDPVVSLDGRRLAYRCREGVEELELWSGAVRRHPAFDRHDLGGAELLAGWSADGGYIVVMEQGRERFRWRAPAPVRRLRFGPGRSPVLYVLTRERLWRLGPRGGASELFRAPEGAELRDLEVGGEQIWIGMRRRSAEGSCGERVVLDSTGEVLGRWRTPWKPVPRAPVRRSSRGIPWPVEPNAQHPVGDTYGEFQDYGSGPYLHPGVDVMIAAGEPVFAVAPGVVKAVLTTSGEWHWRVAVADQPGPGESDGYLYAHLERYSIAVEVGDVVFQGQYLGDIVDFPFGFHHTHFARIRDEGSVWQGNWLCTDNPHLDFENQSETTAPEFFPAIPGQAFAFCTNQTSNYLPRNALQGAVDIVVRVRDVIDYPAWPCAVQELRYSIYPVGQPQSPVVDDKLAVYFDMPLDHYQGGSGDELLVQLFYKRDATCWSNRDWSYADFYHVITNSDGDQNYEESDLREAWDTTQVFDGQYVVEVTAYDVAGNSTVESMVVTTVNGNYPSPTPIPSATPLPTATPEASVTPEPSPTASATFMPTETPSPPPGPSATPGSPTPEASGTPAGPSPTPSGATATPEATVSPGATATPAHPFGVRLELPAMVHPGEEFRVTGFLDNPDEDRSGVAVFFVLDVYGELWFWPSWAHYAPPGATGYDFRLLDVPRGVTPVEVVPPFVWPDTGSRAATGLYFHGAMLNETQTAIAGRMASEEWGFGPS